MRTGAVLERNVDDPVDLLWTRAEGALPVVLARLPAGLLRILLELALGEGSRLALSRALRLLEQIAKPVDLSLKDAAARTTLGPSDSLLFSLHAGVIGRRDNSLEPVFSNAGLRRRFFPRAAELSADDPTRPGHRSATPLPLR
jgi:hypothetical protein